MGAWFFTPFLTGNSKGRAPLVWMRPCTRAREQETPPKGEDFPDVSHWGVDKWPLAQQVQTGWWPHPGTQGAPCSVCTVPPEAGTLRSRGTPGCPAGDSGEGQHVVGQAEHVSSADPILGPAMGPHPTSSPSSLAGGREMQGERLSQRLRGTGSQGPDGTGAPGVGDPCGSRGLSSSPTHCPHAFCPRGSCRGPQPCLINGQAVS